MVINMARVFTVEEVIKIKSIAKSIMEFTIENSTSKLPRCFSFLQRIIKNIEADERDEFTDIEALSKYIFDDYRMMFDAHCGIQEYYINVEDREKRMKANQRLGEMIKSLIDVVERHGY